MVLWQTARHSWTNCQYTNRSDSYVYPSPMQGFWDGSTEEAMLQRTLHVPVHLTSKGTYNSSDWNQTTIEMNNWLSDAAWRGWCWTVGGTVSRALPTTIFVTSSYHCSISTWWALYTWLLGICICGAYIYLLSIAHEKIIQTIPKRARK